MSSPKQLLFHEGARDRIRRGVDALAEAVCVTLRFWGRTVVLEIQFGTAQIVNSGVVVARFIEFEDPFEDMGAQMLREVAIRTSEMAGDGTTTATVLAPDTIHQGLRCLDGGMNLVDIKRGMERATVAVARPLQSMAKPCTTAQNISRVASISANNDRSVGDLLAAAIDKMGREGAIAIEDGSGLVNLLEVVEGLEFDRGFLSPYFINNAERQMAVLQNVYILLCAGHLSRIHDLLPPLELLVKEARPVLVVAEGVDSDALSMLVITTLCGALKSCAIKAPGFGEQHKALLLDLACLTCARVVGEEAGLTPAHVSLSDLGQARRVEVGKDSTTLIGGNGQSQAVQHRLAAIRQEWAATGSHLEKERLDERAAKLSSVVAVINVGATTETDLKIRKLRVEDALHATRVAVQERIVPGGDVALVRARRGRSIPTAYNMDERSGMQLVMRALKGSLRRIVMNAGEEASPISNRVEASSDAAFGYDAATRLALQHAAPIAGLVLATDCWIAQRRPSVRAGLRLEVDAGNALM